jgi:hypothetical protein
MIATALTGLLAIGGGYILLKYGIQILVIGVTLILVALGFKKKS